MLKTNKKIWNEFKEIIKEKLESFEIKEEEMQNGIYYLNANDGTEFDVKANGNMCEFARLYKDNYMAIKVYFQRNGDLLIYCFDKNHNCIDEDKIENFISRDEFIEFCSNVCEYTDNIEIWDEPIDEEMFEKEYETQDFFYEEEDDEDDDYEND